MIIPEDYYKKEINIFLTQAEIEEIIECLSREQHNIFEFLNFEKIIKKLKKKK
jgi:hypothetical protein